jgi:hypothetical protein
LEKSNINWKNDFQIFSLSALYQETKPSTSLVHSKRNSYAGFSLPEFQPKNYSLIMPPQLGMRKLCLYPTFDDNEVRPV